LTVPGATTKSELDAVVKNFSDRLYHKRNAKNLKAFVESFKRRTELTGEDLNAMRPNVLLVTGKDASFNHTVRAGPYGKGYPRGKKTAAGRIRVGHSGPG
jgi:hypothetical protein